MARTLEQLQKQYNSSSKKFAGGGGGRGRMMGAKGKPKNARKTIGRLLSYLSQYVGRLSFVLVCMLISTVCSLVGGYLIAPIIDRIACEVKHVQYPHFVGIEAKVDNFICKITTAVFGDEIRIMQYVGIALGVLAAVYLISGALSYIMARMMSIRGVNGVRRNGAFKEEDMS